MKTGLLIAVVLSTALRAPFVACAQPDPPGFAAPPKEKLDGQRLLLKEFYCAIAVPGNDWKWLAAAGGSSFLCFNTRNGAGYAVSTGILAAGVTEHVKDEVVEGAEKSAQASGVKLSNIKWQPAEIPLPKKSWRLTYDVTFKDNARIGVIIYLVETSQTTLVTLQDSSVAGSESAMFRQFVSSLKVTR